MGWERLLSNIDELQRLETQKPSVTCLLRQPTQHQVATSFTPRKGHLANLRIMLATAMAARFLILMAKWE